MALFSVLLASLFLALGNLLMRKSVDSGGTTKAYLVLQLSFCFFVSIVLGPIRTDSYAINGPVVFFGLLAGATLITLLSLLGKALEKGPPGLTFSILSSSAVFPALVMAAIFGQQYGFSFTLWHAMGSLLVLIGLFWAGSEASKNEAAMEPVAKLHSEPNLRFFRWVRLFAKCLWPIGYVTLQKIEPTKKSSNFAREASFATGSMGALKIRGAWLFLVSLMFMLHILLLLIYQWRGVMLRTEALPQLGSEWFVPMMYLGAASIQIAIFLKTERRKLQPREWTFGFFGGVFNSLCTFFLLYGTNNAVGLENAVIFPIYSIGTIVFSNLWSQKLYGERVNWRACQVCALGIFLGSVDWKATLAALSS